MLFVLLDDVKREKWARRKTLPIRKSVPCEAKREVKIQIIRIHRENQAVAVVVLAECAVRASLHNFLYLSRRFSRTYSAFETCVW